ncbi:MAG TPA: hypothetical protein VK459_09995 [Polyangiaceae bacterium]|jgi:hypothetical protein|nr:hypothetical protein [Polyangiaceae bacterium]
MSNKTEAMFGPVSIPVAGLPLDVARMMAACTPEERIQIRAMLRVDKGDERTEITLETVRGVLVEFVAKRHGQRG